MPRYGAIKRTELVRLLRKNGFTGPYSGTKHQFMVKGELRLRIPNPHLHEIRKELLALILKQAGISFDK